MTEFEVRQCQFPIDRCLDQFQSPLFDIMPAEIRERIFDYALTDSEQMDKAYAMDTCYRRPDYLAPRRTHMELLQTCQRVYREAWSVPWANVQHTFYLTETNRCPERTTTVKRMQNTLNALHSSAIETLVKDVQIFAQLFRIEGGQALQEILDMDHFHPRSLTITIRHTDCWFWEDDDALRIGAQWVNDCRFPASLRQLNLQLESLERKQDQVDSITTQAAKQWQFARQDNIALVSDPSTITSMRWTGSSTWEGKRWVRDEVRPEELDYYVATVTWRPQRALAGPATQEQHALIRPCANEIRVRAARAMSGHAANWVPTADLKSAQVPPRTPAYEAISMVQTWRRQNAAGARQQNDNSERMRRVQNRLRRGRRPPIRDV